MSEQAFFDTYCPQCDTEVRAHVESRRETFNVNGDGDIEVLSEVAVCPVCGGTIGDLRLDGKNLEKAYAVYRARHGIPSVGELKALRARYGMSVRQFSRFLGFGEQTYAAYEAGRMPDALHARMIRLAMTPEGAGCLIPLAEGSVSQASLDKARAFAAPALDSLRA